MVVHKPEGGRLVFMPPRHLAASGVPIPGLIPLIGLVFPGFTAVRCPSLAILSIRLTRDLILSCISCNSCLISFSSFAATGVAPGSSASAVMMSENACVPPLRFCLCETVIS